MRRRRENPFSLFSFQDIITGLCGIMIFMVLVQVVGIVLEKDATPRIEQEEIADDRRAELRREIAQLERELAKVKAQASRVVVAARDRARPSDLKRKAELDRNLTEKEKIVAALVSQVHDLETQVEAARKADAEDREKVREMERTRRLLEQQIAGMKGRRGITLFPERGDFKTPVYMVCSGSGVDVHRPFETAKSLKIASADVAMRLGEFLDALDHTTHSVVLLVRPSGVRLMDQAVEMLKARSFSYGRDPLEESVEVVFDAKEGGAR